MNPETQAILNHIPPALLVIVRLGGLMLYGPILGSAVIPARLKIFLTIITGLAVYPMLSSTHLGGSEVKLELFTLAPLVAMEFMIGLIIGFLASLPLLAMQMGGLVMGQQMGLGFAQLYNPAIDDEADVVGQMLFFMAVATFVIIGGHEWMVLAVLHSFEYVPLGGFSVNVNLLSLVNGILLSTLDLALRVAAPLLALIFLETVAMGFMAKTVPQLNVLSLGFPVRILAGLAVIAVGLTVIHDVAVDGMVEAFAAISQWIEGL